MALVNQAKREINAKIVFFGPGLSGKGTNLKHVYNKLKPEFRGAMKAMNVQDARMLFFDFTPPGDGNVDGFRVRFHVYTVSGRHIDPAAWKMVLKGVDGIVFVADAQPDRQEANRESFDNLNVYLKAYGQSVSSIPTVLQYNKSDLAEQSELAELERLLNASKLQSFKASSQSGEGVLQTILALVKTVLTGLRSKGMEGLASPEALQRMVETPVAPKAEPAPAVQPAPTFEPAPAAEPAPTAELTPAAEPELPPQAQQASAESVWGALSAPAEAEPAAQPARPGAFEPQHAAQAPQEPLSLEVTGAPEASEPGLFRLPLTIRSGARSKSVVLTLSISLEEE